MSFVLTGLGSALLIAGVLSPFASSDPDGLDRVSSDYGFSEKAEDNPPAHHLPFYHIFDAYSLRGVPQALATPLAGIGGTLLTFGLAWGAGKLLTHTSSKGRSLPSDSSD
jgi:cobalt/nickel transport protein